MNQSLRKVSCYLIRLIQSWHKLNYLVFSNFTNLRASQILSSNFLKHHKEHSGIMFVNYNTELVLLSVELIELRSLFKTSRLLEGLSDVGKFTKVSVIKAQGRFRENLPVFPSHISVGSIVILLMVLPVS